jgi:CSLREA domain-containing protein
MRIFSRSVILFCLLLLIIPTYANNNNIPQFASTGGYRVTVTTDSNDGTCNNHCSLREAIIAANNSTELNPIVYIPNGTYTLSIAGADEDAAATGDLDITRPLSIIGEGRDTTIIDANDLDRAFDVHGTGLTSIDENNPYGDWSDVQFLLSDVTVQNGSATGADGGGMRIASTPPSVPTITLIDVIIQNSQAENGGGLATQDIHFQSIRLRLLNNVASNHGGGAYYSALNYISNPIIITESGLLANGNSAQLGGGIYYRSDSQREGDLYHLLSGAIVNNSAVDGGGIYLDGNYYAELYGTFSGNTAANNGGGIYSHDSSASLAFSTITNNTADGDNNGSGDGGAIYVVDPNSNGHSIGASIVYGNVDKGGEAPQCAAIDFTIPVQYSVLAPFAPCIIEESGWDGGNVFADPLLLPLDDYGGQTLTHALQAGSPAIGLSSPFCNFNYDQRGVWRGFHTCDSGAYAYLDGLPLTSVPPTTYISDYGVIVLPGETVTNSLREYPLHVSFTKHLINIPNSTTHPTEIDNPANYRLVLPGVDDVFQTNSCAAILNDDLNVEFSVTEEQDVIWEIFESDIQIIPVTNGMFAHSIYRLIVCDEITDLDGNALDGDADGTAGGDAYFDIDFAYQSSPTELLVTTTEDVTDSVCNSHCSLRDAVRVANSTSSATTIFVPAGTYKNIQFIVSWHR